MSSEKIGRRKFIKRISSTLLGLTVTPVLKPISSLAETKKTPPLEYRTLGKTGLKVTVVGMGLMNCSDPAVLARAFDLGINFYDTADCYMWGKNEEMVGKAFQGKRDKVLIQTKVHENEEKKMRASVERSLRRLKTLQRHHIANGVTVCSTCHTSIPVPPPENVSPPYYGTADTLANNPCNPVAQNLVNENWTTNCCEGMDTDGDNVYDGADPDCSAVPQTPGEASAASQMRVTAYDKVGGTITISYGTACVATDNRIEHGLLGGLSSYSYAGQVCAIGNTGTASFTITNGSFFLVVANDASKEGSYGERRTGTTLAERPEDMTSLTCPLPQDLANRCDP